MLENPDVLIIGAGVAGLTAALKLSQAGLAVTILEARDRVGGRIWTHHDSKSNISTELGAEFIHGLVPEVWQPLQENNVEVSEVDGDLWCVRKGKLCPCDFFGEVDDILKKMKESPRDRSFLQFLNQCCPNQKKDPKLEEVRESALRYVTGFNAADPGKVSVNWLVQEMRAEEQVNGDRAFRIRNGYDTLTGILRGKIERVGISVNLGHVVKTVRWQRKRVKVAGETFGRKFAMIAPRALITVPLGVLRAGPNRDGALRFIPSLPLSKRNALTKLAMGHVIRVTLVFRERFWERIRASGAKSKNLADLSFMFSSDRWFPTWWTAMPDKTPTITAWAPFQSAHQLSGQSRKFVIDHAVGSLSRLLTIPAPEIRRQLESAHFHDWQSDSFSRGAYSYVKVGGKNAPRELGKPIEKTLFFAGEATDIAGQTGTVHGAIASGQRAAQEISSANRSMFG